MKLGKMPQKFFNSVKTRIFLRIFKDRKKRAFSNHDAESLKDVWV